MALVQKEILPKIRYRSFLPMADSQEVSVPDGVMDNLIRNLWSPFLEPLYNDYGECSIAGGAVAHVVRNGTLEGVNDIDVFFAGKESCEQATRKLKRDCGFSKESNVAVEIPYHGHKLHLIQFPFMGSANIQISRFDFTCVSAALSPTGLYFHEDFFDDLKAKRIRIVHPENIRRGITRMKKYMDKGFVPSAKTFLQILNIQKSKALMY